MRRRHFFFPLITFVIVGVLWTTVIISKELNFNVINKNIFVLTNDLVIVNTMILPLLVGILCSRIMDIEHSGNTFKMLQTSNQNINQLYISKVVVATLLIFILDMLQTTYLVILSSLYGISLNWLLISAFSTGFLLVSFILITFHLFISFIFEKQSIGIVLALIGSFIGLVTSGMLPNIVQLFLPWQYYSLLNPTQRFIENDQYRYSFNPNYQTYFIILLFLSLLQILIIRKKIKEVEL